MLKQSRYQSVRKAESLTDSDLELQIRGGIVDMKRISLFLNENIYCDPSLEPSQRDGSNDGSQHIFHREIWKIILKLFLLPLLIWSTFSDPHLVKSQDTMTFRGQSSGNSI